MKSDFIVALTQLAAERNLPREIVLSAIEAALVSAYRRDSVEAGQDISVTLDPASGDVSIYVVKTVVEEVEEPEQQLTLAQASKIKPGAEIGDVIQIEELPHTSGRIAAQTAKQVVIQRLREAERELVFEEYADKEGEVYTVAVQRIEPQHITVELGRAEATLPASETGPYERFRVGQRLKVLLQAVRRSSKGPEVIVSRTDKLLLRRLFEMEVPEIYSGAVEIKAIAREGGLRSKVAVWAKQDGVDAVGSCVGLRGIRIQNIVNELGGEKIDVVQWDKDPKIFIANALSPSQVMRVDVNLEQQSAVAVVPERQLSLAIGKDGQNARLAARLTGLSIDIKTNVTDEVVAENETASELPTQTIQEQAEEIVETALLAETSDITKTVEEELKDPVMEAKEALPIEAEIAEPKHELIEPEAIEVEPEAIEVEPEAIEVEPEEAEADSEEAGVTVEEQVAEQLLAENVEENAAVVESTSISDLSDEIWSVKGVKANSTGVIRFAEDIDELSHRGPREGRRKSPRKSAAGSARGRNKKPKRP